MVCPQTLLLHPFLHHVLGRGVLLKDKLVSSRVIVVYVVLLRQLPEVSRVLED